MSQDNKKSRKRQLAEPIESGIAKRQNVVRIQLTPELVLQWIAQQYKSLPLPLAWTNRTQTKFMRLQPHSGGTDYTKQIINRLQRSEHIRRMTPQSNSNLQTIFTKIAADLQRRTSIPFIRDFHTYSVAMRSNLTVAVNTRHRTRIERNKDLFASLVVNTEIGIFEIRISNFVGGKQCYASHDLKFDFYSTIVKNPNTTTEARVPQQYITIIPIRNPNQSYSLGPWDDNAALIRVGKMIEVCQVNKVMQSTNVRGATGTEIMQVLVNPLCQRLMSQLNKCTYLHDFAHVGSPSVLYRQASITRMGHSMQIPGYYTKASRGGWVAVDSDSFAKNGFNTEQLASNDLMLPCTMRFTLLLNILSPITLNLFSQSLCNLIRKMSKSPTGHTQNLHNFKRQPPKSRFTQELISTLAEAQQLMADTPAVKHQSITKILRFLFFLREEQIHPRSTSEIPKTIAAQSVLLTHLQAIDSNCSRVISTCVECGILSLQNAIFELKPKQRPQCPLVAPGFLT